MVDVPDVEGEALLPADLVAPVHLGPAGEAGPDGVAAVLGGRVAADVRHRQGPGPDEAHLASEHVPQLGQLVEAERPEEPAQSGEALLVGQELAVGVALVRHRAELDHLEGLGVAAEPSLAEQHRAAHLEAHEDGHHHQDRQAEQQPGRRHRDVDRPFQGGAAQRRDEAHAPTARWVVGVRRRRTASGVWVGAPERGRAAWAERCGTPSAGFPVPRRCRVARGIAAVHSSRSWAMRVGAGDRGVEVLHRVRIERRHRDVGDERVHPADDVLAVAEEVLVELLAGAQAGVDDVDRPARLGDQPARHVVEEHRLAHVENEGLTGLVVLADGPRGLDHQLHRLVDGHEVAGDVGVGDGHRPAGSIWARKACEHRAPAAEDVPEPHARRTTRWRARRSGPSGARRCASSSRAR